MITVYTKDNCPFCERAKAFLKAKDIAFDEVHLSEVFDPIGIPSARKYITKEQLLEIIPTARTMPQIVIDGEPIGGYNELIKLNLP